MAETLCRSCGMCCDGTLFDLGRIETDDDVRALETDGLVVLERNGRWFFQQPCNCFDRDICTIYPRRPARCRAYQCKVLDGLVSGSMPVEEAHRLVAKAVDWRRILITQLGDRFGGAGLSLAARWRALKAGGGADAESEVAFGGFLALLDRHFRRPSGRETQ